MFDGIEYLKKITAANRLAQSNHFMVSTTTDLHTLQPLMDNYNHQQNFALVMDTVDGAMVGGHPGWFDRRVYTVALIMRHKWNDEADRRHKLATCRELFRQTLTRLIVDRERYEYEDEQPVFLRTDDMQYREMPPYSFAGATGVVYTLRIDEPTCLCYNSQDFTD